MTALRARRAWCKAVPRSFGVGVVTDADDDESGDGFDSALGRRASWLGGACALDVSSSSQRGIGNLCQTRTSPGGGVLVWQRIFPRQGVLVRGTSRRTGGVKRDRYFQRDGQLQTRKGDAAGVLTFN